MNKEKRTFAVADIHGDYAALTQALGRAGFCPRQDTLIVCGDCFDRGTENLEVCRFLKSLPNKVLIRGNHELLALRVIDRGGVLSRNDVFNGLGTTFGEFNTPKLQQELKEFIDSMVWYHETSTHLFLHSFTFKALTEIYGGNVQDINWEEVSWSKAFIEYINRHILMPIPPNEPFPKITVFGHWQTAEFHALRGKRKDEVWISPFETGYKFVGLDTTTARSNYVGIYEVETGKVW